jgi:hypothetical protein
VFLCTQANCRDVTSLWYAQHVVLCVSTQAWALGHTCYTGALMVARPVDSQESRWEGSHLQACRSPSCCCADVAGPVHSNPINQEAAIAARVSVTALGMQHAGRRRAGIGPQPDSWWQVEMVVFRSLPASQNCLPTSPPARPLACQPTKILPFLSILSFFLHAL